MMGLPDFTGEMGGLLAAMFMTGISIGWGLCVKIRVQPLRDQATKLELKLDDLLSKIEAAFWNAR
jgi:uncharacterized membrane protein YciS (DUF1049 family)